MPTGAKNVPLCFSAASMKLKLSISLRLLGGEGYACCSYMVKISSAVKNISMNRPWITVVFGLVFRVVRTARGPGNRADTTAAAAIAPMIWVKITRNARSHPTAPIRARPKATYSREGIRQPYQVEKIRMTAYRWVEQSTADPEEHPNVHCKAEAECERNVKQNSDIWRHGDAGGLLGSEGGRAGIGDLSCSEGKEEKEKGADEFTEHCDHVVAHRIW